MTALIVGYGSIGRRHARILSALGHDVILVTSQQTTDFPTYNRLEQALLENPGYVIIANETGGHYRTLETLAYHNYDGNVLIEKPLFEKEYVIPTNCFATAAVGYNLRFHPVIQYLRDCIYDENVISAHIYVGQYLPIWRPSTDYSKSYSARISGGGVLLDLSHELDYVCWLFNGWESVVATGGHYSKLNIESDDVFSILMKTTVCPIVSVNMNYLDRYSRREIIINTNNHTYKGDLIKSTITVDSEVLEIEKPERDVTYFAQHNAVLNNDLRCLCSLDQGLRVVRLVDFIKRSEQERRWINNV